MEQKIFIKTFGCQMNEYDSNRIYGIVKRLVIQKQIVMKMPIVIF